MKKRVFLALMLAGLFCMVYPARAEAMEDEEVEALAEQIGGEYNICPEVLQAIAWKESRYQENAEAGGCSGLMQISEQWHRDRMAELGVTDLHDPDGNMRVAADYIAELVEKYEDIGMVLMVYNGDSQAKNYQETGIGLSDYANSVLELSEQLEREHGK